MTDMVLKVAAKAVIVNDKGEVLILREANTYKDGTNIGKWHMPGGRLDLGETYEAGLHREVMEETGLEVEPQDPIFVGEWHPVIRNTPHQIIAIFTVCKPKTTIVSLSEEHDDFAWIDPTKAADYDIMNPEDKVITRLIERLAR